MPCSTSLRTYFLWICALSTLVLCVSAPAADAMGLRASSTRLGAWESRVQVTVTARKGAQCSASVAAKGARTLRLPTLVVVSRRVAWRWDAPAGAPKGVWRVRALCTYAGHVQRKSTLRRVQVLRKAPAAGFMFPGSLHVNAGRYLHPPGTQNPDPNSSKGAGDGNPGYPQYCTWGAWNRAPWLGTAVYGPPNQNDAKWWADNAARNGLPTGKTPVVGAVFVSTAGKFGHVGIVTGIVNTTTFTTEEMNGGSVMLNAAEGITNEFGKYATHQRNTGDYMRFIYKPGTQPGAFVGHIVHWDGDSKPHKTAWLVGSDGKRRWIPTSAIFYCLKGFGVPGPDVLSAQMLDSYPDLTGQWVSCGPSGFGNGVGTAPSDAQTTPPTGPPPTTPPPAEPPPPPRTWNETVGGNANTWTNHTNAGGTQGPTIPAYTTVAISCKLTGFRVQDGNTWWYRIASAPWSNQYYVSADAFYNNGQTSGSLHGTPFVDLAVADC